MSPNNEDTNPLSLDNATDLAKFAALVASEGWISTPAFEAMANLIPDALFFKDTDGRYLLANAAASQGLSGQSDACILGKSDLDLLSPEQGRYLREADEMVIASREPLVREEQLGNRWFLTTKAPVLGAEGEVIGVIGNARDITARRAAEAALRESEARLRSIVDTVIDGILTATADGTIVSANPAAVQIFGYASETEMVGRNLTMLMPIIDAAEHNAHLACHVATDQSQIIGRSGRVLSGVRKSGETFPIDLSVGSFEAGGQTFFTGVVRDITERVRQEAAERESETRFRAMADNIPQLAWTTDPEGRVNWANQRWYDFTGQSTDNLPEWGWTTVLHPDHIERVTTVWRQHISKGQPWEDTFPIRGKSGAYRWFLSRAMAIRDDEGRITMWFGTNTDITDQRLGEEALRETTRRAERQDAAKSKFLAAASHDLRQPLQAMVFLATTAAKHIRPEGQPAFDKLERSIQTLNELLDNILDVTRLSSEQINPKFTTFPIGELLSKIATAYHDRAAEKNITLHAVESRAMVYSDYDLLFRMISHLVENAVLYTHRGRILIDCVPRNDRVMIEIRDSGVGIDPQQIDLIWDEFFQVGNARRERQYGQGLGLSIVKRLSSLLNHAVTVQSEPGVGSTFSIELPRAREDLQAEDAAIAAVQAQWVPSALRIVPSEIAEVAGPLKTTIPQREPPPLERRRLILVVDDDAMLREAFETIFELWDEPWDTVLAESADAAFQAVPSGACPDFLVMDYRLGDETGDQATQRIRAHFGRDIPAMLLTGDVGDEVQEKARQIGMPLLYKPIDTKQLHAIISGQLELAA